MGTSPLPPVAHFTIAHVRLRDRQVRAPMPPRTPHTHLPVRPPGFPQVVFSAYLDLTVPAAGSDLGRGVFECSSLPAGVMGVVYAWATGMGNLAMPPSVGLPVGTNLTAYSPSMYGVPYVVVQMHYSNASRIRSDAPTSLDPIHHSRRRLTHPLRDHAGGDCGAVRPDTGRARPAALHGR